MEALAVNGWFRVDSAAGLPLSRWRTPLIAAIVLSSLTLGCASRQLQISTTRQAQTVVDLEYRQALDNLAMFHLNPSALPSLVTLKTGATQVGDTGSVGFLGAVGLATGATQALNKTVGSSPTLTGTRTIVDQWGSSPVTDDNNLLLLSKAFHCALGHHDLLDDDDANDLAHDLSPQIGTTADISVDRDTLGTIFSQNVVSGALARFMPPDPSRMNPPPGTLEFDALHRARRLELRMLANRLAGVNEIIDAGLTDTLDHEILARSLSFRYSRKLDVALVKESKEIPEDDEDTVWVATVNRGLLVRIFDSEGKKAFDVQLMPAVLEKDKENDVPKAGKSLIIAAYINKNKTPRFRVFDADGNRIVNTVERLESPQVAINELTRQLNQHSEDKDLTASEKNRITSTVISLADPSALGKIEDLLKKLELERVWSYDEIERRDKRDIIRIVVDITGLKPSMKERFEPFRDSSTGQAKEAIYRLNDIQKTLDEIPSGWLHVGSKKPKEACYIGHAYFCGKSCYVWVCDDGLDGLSKFTRAVLKLGSTFKDVQIVTAPTGIQFAPALSNTPR
jgi:hypothetical protein